jgi:hypothetical protein
VTQLDVVWRKRLEFAALHYEEAKEAVIRAAEYAQSAHCWHEYRDMERTMEAERVALREYTQVLAIFTRLVLDGKAPTDDSEDDEPDPSEVGQFSQSRRAAE